MNKNGNRADKNGTQPKRRLTLHRETLKALDQDDMKKAAGGLLTLAVHSGELKVCGCV